MTIEALVTKNTNLSRRTIESCVENVPLLRGEYAVNPNFIALTLQGCVSIFHIGDDPDNWVKVTYAQNEKTIYQTGEILKIPEWNSSITTLLMYKKIDGGNSREKNKAEEYKQVKELLLKKAQELVSLKYFSLIEDLGEYVDKHIETITQTTTVKAGLVHEHLFQERCLVYKDVCEMIQRHKEIE